MIAVTHVPRQSIRTAPSAERTASPRSVVSTVVQYAGRRLWCRATRAAHSGSETGSAGGPGATYVTLGSASSNDSAWNDLPERTPPVIRTFIAPR